MEKPKLLCDENFSYEVTLALRRAGFDATHISEEGRKGASDDAQLLFAIQEDRAILTQDRNDFEHLHLEYMRNGWEHCGIVICTSYNTRTMIRELLDLLRDKPAPMSNAIWHI